MFSASPALSLLVFFNEHFCLKPFLFQSLPTVFSFTSSAKLVSIKGCKIEQFIKEDPSDPSIFLSVQLTWVYGIYFYSEEEARHCCAENNRRRG